MVLPAILLLTGAPVRGQVVTPMAIAKTQFQVRLGEPVEIPASGDTLDFLLHANTRTVLSGGKTLEGMVVAPTESNDGVVLVPSAQVTPGDYALMLSATSESGEQRAAAISVTVRPRASVPKGSSHPPVVLLNGWQEGFTGSCPVSTTTTATFGNLAQQLIDAGVPVVYLFDNCAEGANLPIEQLGNNLKTYLNTIKFDDGTQVQQIDLIGFSLGGLIARAYLAGLQPNLTYAPPDNTLVRKLVLIATPNFGSYLVGNSFFLAGTQGSELSPGSGFLWNLATWNQRGDDLHGADAIAIVGNAGTYNPPLFSSGVQINNGGDGVVSLNSASLGFASIASTTSTTQPAERTRVIPYCHVDPSAFTNTAFGAYLCGQPGIARVANGHLTSQIVLSFLGGTDTWKSIGTAASADPYLKVVGGAYFAMQNASGGYVSDLSSVSWGSILLSQGASLGTIFYTEFVSGSDRYTANSASLRSVDCGILKGAVGFMAATRCKIGTALVSVTPLSTTAGGVAVTAGTAITLNGLFGTQCSNCRVTATPAGSSTVQVLTVNSWTNTAIQVQLPATLTGYSTLTVNAAPGNDSLGIVAVAAAAPAATLTVAPASLDFSYTIGGALPDKKSFTIGASDSSALAWTAAASDTWMSLSAASGTTPSTVDVTIAIPPAGAGAYNGKITITSAGASNSPITIPVTLTVTAAPAALIVTPLALAFNYTSGGAVPVAQPVSVTSSGALSWTASSSDYWAVVTKDSAISLSISIRPQNLAAGTYKTNVTVTPDNGSAPAVVAITLTVVGTPGAGTITAAADAASFRPNIAAAGWVAIFGTNLSGITYSWQGSDFVDGQLPTSLAGVSVTINGIAAYPSYVSPGQINVLAPDDGTTGPVQVRVTVAGQTSNSFTVQKATFAPAFFTFSPTSYIAALHLDYSYLGKANLVAGATLTPAKPGETILLYAAGLGPTNPATPTGQTVTGAPLANTVQMTIGGVSVTPDFVGLSAPGLYQFNVKVPDLPDGDAVVVATVGGVSTQAGTAIAIQK